MGKKLYSEESVQAIATAIRGKNGSSDTYKVSEMAAAITAIPSGGSSDFSTVNVTIGDDTVGGLTLAAPMLEDGSDNLFATVPPPSGIITV